MPNSQWFGRGLGHNGSTSNLGACSPEACTAAFFSSIEDVTPSTIRTAKNVATTESLPFKNVMRFLLHGKTAWLTATRLTIASTPPRFAIGEIGLNIVFIRQYA
jgi:hypothetical protein